MSASTAIPKSPNSSLSRRKSEGQVSRALPRPLKARSLPGDTTLQRHASFFDDNGDRAIDAAECTRGLKALGLPFGVAEVAALAIVVPLSVQTRGSLLALSIDIENIHARRISLRRLEIACNECAPRQRGWCAAGSPSGGRDPPLSADRTVPRRNRSVGAVQASVSRRTGIPAARTAPTAHQE